MEMFLTANGIDPNEKDPTRRDAFFGNLLKTNADSAFLDMNYFSQYNPDMGFRFGIERIHDNKVNGFFAV